MVAVGIVVGLERILSIKESSKANEQLTRQKFPGNIEMGCLFSCASRGWVIGTGLHDRAKVGGQLDMANDRLSFTVFQ